MEQINPNQARLKMTKRLFQGTSGEVQRLARQAHAEMRLKQRAQYWAQHTAQQSNPHMTNDTL